MHEYKYFLDLLYDRQMLHQCGYVNVKNWCLVRSNIIFVPPTVHAMAKRVPIKIRQVGLGYPNPLFCSCFTNWHWSLLPPSLEMGTSSGMKKHSYSICASHFDFFEVPDWKQCVASTVCSIALNTTVNCNVLLHLKSCCFIPHPICLSEPELGSETRLFINADKQKCFSSLKISTLTRCFKTHSSLCVVRTIQDRLETEENKWRWNWHHCFCYLN